MLVFRWRGSGDSVQCPSDQRWRMGFIAAALAGAAPSPTGTWMSTQRPASVACLQGGGEDLRGAAELQEHGAPGFPGP